jgi:hypothetical protein
MKPYYSVFVKERNVWREIRSFMPITSFTSAQKLENFYKEKGYETKIETIS